MRALLVAFLVPLAASQLPMGRAQLFGGLGGLGMGGYGRRIGGWGRPMVSGNVRGVGYSGTSWNNGFNGVDAKSENEAVKSTLENAKKAYDEYKKALLTARQEQQTRALERQEANKPLTNNAYKALSETDKFKATAICRYTFQCESGELCINGGCLQIGPAHEKKSCGTEFSTGCADTESCWNYSCLPDPSKNA